MLVHPREDDMDDVDLIQEDAELYMETDAGDRLTIDSLEPAPEKQANVKLRPPSKLKDYSCTGLLVLICVSTVLGGLLLLVTLVQTKSSAPTWKAWKLDPQSTFTLTLLDPTDKEGSNSLARSHLSMDRQAGHMRIDFAGNPETQHATLLDIGGKNCSQYDVDWFLNAGMQCRQTILDEPLCIRMRTSFVDGPANPVHVYILPRVLENRQVVDQVMLSSDAYLLRHPETHLPLQYHIQDKVYVVSHYQAQFTQNWDAVIHYCESGQVRGLVAPELSRMPAELWGERAANPTARLWGGISPTARLWAEMSMENKCDKTRAHRALEWMDGEMEHGNWCRFGTQVDKNITSGDWFLPDRERLECPDQETCPDDLDRLCREQRLGQEYAYRRFWLDFAITTCLDNDRWTSLLSMTNVTYCQTTVCQSTHQALLAFYSCFPCDRPMTHWRIVPNWNQTDFFLPELERVTRWNLHSLAR